MSPFGSQSLPSAPHVNETTPLTRSHPPTFSEQRVVAPRATLAKVLSHTDRTGVKQQDGVQPEFGKGSKTTGLFSKTLKKRQASQPDVPMPDHKTTIATNRYEQSPKRFHLPNTGQEEQHVYVLTLKMTSSIAKPMNDMRLEHFPAHLNRTPAHLTLFHALPHSQISTMQNNLNAIATYAKPFPISTGTPFRIGRGVGIGLGEGAKDCIGLHDALRAEWLGFLSDQDQGGWKPHWTVMNKVSDEKQVKAAFNTIRRDLFENTYHGLVVGLDIWKYDHGKWDWMKEFNFVGNGKVDDVEALRHESVSSTNSGGSAEDEDGTQATGAPKKGLTKADMKSRKGSGGIKDMFKSMSVRKGLKKDYEW